MMLTGASGGPRMPEMTRGQVEVIRAVTKAIADVCRTPCSGIPGDAKRRGCRPPGPGLPGVILPRRRDGNGRRAIVAGREDPGRFLRGTVTRPFSLAPSVSVIPIFASRTPPWTRVRARLFNRGTASS